MLNIALGQMKSSKALNGQIQMMKIVLMQILMKMKMIRTILILFLILKNFNHKICVTHTLVQVQGARTVLALGKQKREMTRWD